MSRNLGRARVASYSSNHSGAKGQILAVFNVPMYRDGSGRKHNIAHAVMIVDDHIPPTCNDAECLIVVELDDLVPEDSQRNIRRPE